ncbi:DNA-directed RNA polymerase III subunit Rpc5 [Aspergillus avenaceus]|uniref:DNA-directed RNA polymerase III subunit Rpc5 n=1 Tax=Aspergillus avenaceus TaxID=36643 RepID=A0A5N6TW40_ASPAV|nr:DNA-directed RNA polymerase III subunit Rpc5 [Aspergillus avenaceus]
MDSPDPVIASYDVYLTDSEISRYVLQYLDRLPDNPFDDRHGQKPTAFRLKPNTGLVEVDVPINTRVNYDVNKGLKYGDAMKKSRSAQNGGAFGMAGGFNTGATAAAGNKVKMENGKDVEMGGMGNGDSASLLRVQTLGGRIKIPEEGDPVYMLAAFRGNNLHLSPVSAVVQVHPQLHHVDALDEIPKGKGKSRKEDDAGGENEARTIDVKIKSAEDNEPNLGGNLDLLKQMQDEKWGSFEWVDAETEESWQVYESYMMHQDLESLPQLESAINSEDYLDKMSAPRIDPAHPEMTGWAMKQNRMKQGGRRSASRSSTEED